MIISMTGYGKAQAEIGGKSVTVECRSLNSRYMDLNLKIPSAFKEKELDIRNISSRALVRGKAEVAISMEEGEDNGSLLNKPLFKQYYQELSSLMEENNMPPADLLNAIIRMPNILQSGEETLADEEWKALQKLIEKAIGALREFRLSEGAQLEEDLLLRNNAIMASLKGIEAKDTDRVARIRERIKGRLEEISLDKSYDENRFEQELIYYIEKLDITEEVVRLKSHCDYFAQVIHDKEAPEKGKKLGFISQEMGREINTIGSKASEAEVQKLVVQMKEELEKIKEQLNNVL